MFFPLCFLVDKRDPKLLPKGSVAATCKPAGAEIGDSSPSPPRKSHGGRDLRFACLSAYGLRIQGLGDRVEVLGLLAMSSQSKFGVQV